MKFNIDFAMVKCYSVFYKLDMDNKCDEQKVVGWKEPGESCRLVRGKGGVLHEFILLAVR